MLQAVAGHDTSKLMAEIDKLPSIDAYYGGPFAQCSNKHTSTDALLHPQLQQVLQLMRVLWASTHLLADIPVTSH